MKSKTNELALEQKIEKLKEYKQVLIDEVVRGKRRVPSVKEVKAS